MKFYCWINLLIDGSVDKMLAALINAKFTVSPPILPIKDRDKPCYLIEISLEKDYKEKGLDAIKTLVLAKEEICIALDTANIRHYGVIVSDQGAASAWGYTNISLSKELAARKDRINKSSHLSLVPKPMEEQPKEPS